MWAGGLVATALVVAAEPPVGVFGAVVGEVVRAAAPVETDVQAVSRTAAMSSEVRRTTQGDMTKTAGTNPETSLCARSYSKVR